MHLFLPLSQLSTCEGQEKGNCPSGPRTGLLEGRAGVGVHQTLFPEQSGSGRKVSLGGLQAQPPVVTGLDGGDICSTEEGQKNNRAIVPSPQMPKHQSSSSQVGILAAW